MNPNTPNVSLREAESTDNVFIWYFICRVAKKVAKKLPEFQISTLSNDMKANMQYGLWSFDCKME